MNICSLSLAFTQVAIGSTNVARRHRAGEQRIGADEVYAFRSEPSPLNSVFDIHGGFVTSTASDWRLQGQEAYLLGVALHLRPYVPAQGNDHDHCEFCGEKFILNQAGALQEGYATEDGYRWVCVECFSDFAEQFRWTTSRISEA